MLQLPHRRPVGALRECAAHLAFACGKRQDEVGLAVLEEVGDLARTVVRIDRHTAHPDGVQGQFVQDVLGTVLEQSRYALSGTVAGISVSGGQLRNAPPGLPVRDFEAGWEIVPSFARRHGKERTVAVRRDR